MSMEPPVGPSELEMQENDGPTPSESERVGELLAWILWGSTI